MMSWEAKLFLRWACHLLSQSEDPWDWGNIQSLPEGCASPGPRSRGLFRRMPKLPAPLKAATFSSISLSPPKAANGRLTYPQPKCWSLITPSVRWSHSPGSLFTNEVLVSLEQKLPHSELRRLGSFPRQTTSIPEHRGERIASLLLMNLPLTGSVEARNALQLRSAHLPHPPRDGECLLPGEFITAPRLPWDSFGRQPLSMSYRPLKASQQKLRWSPSKY